MFQSLKRWISGTIFLQSRYTILRFLFFVFFWRGGGGGVCVFVCFLRKQVLKSLFVNIFLFIVYCRFKRNMKDPDMIDLTEPLYLVYASGPISTSHNNIS